MVTPASLYIFRSFLKGSIETLVRHAFSLAACSCCSGVVSPRPRPPPPPPRAAPPPPGAGITHSCPFHAPRLAPGGNSAGMAPRSPPRPPPPGPSGPPGPHPAAAPPPAAPPTPPAGSIRTARPAAPGAAPAGRSRCAAVALDRPTHQLHRSDARVDDVLQGCFGALIGHGAVAVSDGPDLHAFNLRVGFPLGEGGEEVAAAQHRRGGHARQRQLSEFTSAQHQVLLSGQRFPSTLLPVRDFVQSEPLNRPGRRRLGGSRLRDPHVLCAHRREADHGGLPLALALGHWRAPAGAVDRHLDLELAWRGRRGR